MFLFFILCKLYCNKGFLILLNKVPQSLLSLGTTLLKFYLFTPKGLCSLAPVLFFFFFQMSRCLSFIQLYAQTHSAPSYFLFFSAFLIANLIKVKIHKLYRTVLHQNKSISCPVHHYPDVFINFDFKSGVKGIFCDRHFIDTQMALTKWQ